MQRLDTVKLSFGVGFPFKLKFFYSVFNCFDDAIEQHRISFFEGGDIKYFMS